MPVLSAIHRGRIFVFTHDCSAIFNDFLLSLCGLFVFSVSGYNCNESQSDEVNGVGSIPVWIGGMDFEEIGQKPNRSF